MVKIPRLHRVRVCHCGESLHYFQGRVNILKGLETHFLNQLLTMKDGDLHLYKMISQSWNCVSCLWVICLSYISEVGWASLGKVDVTYSQGPNRTEQHLNQNLITVVRLSDYVRHCQSDVIKPLRTILTRQISRVITTPKDVFCF